MTDSHISGPVPDNSTIVVWFSCGAASAVAAKQTIERYGERCQVRVVNNPVIEEDEDNRRFLIDVQAWLGIEIEIAINPKFPNCSARETWEDKKFMAGNRYAPCTEQLKKHARQHWENENHHDFLVLGFTAEEKRRFDRFKLTERDNILPILIESNTTKDDCFAILREAKVELPRAYRLGYPNSNCFSGNTEFLTDMGVRRLDEAVGESVRVRGVGNGWKEATIQSFGVQPLVKLTIRRNNVDREIFTTENHRWFVKNTRHDLKAEKITLELQVGDKLCSMPGQLAGRVRPSAFAIAQGIVFGDGSRASKMNSAARITLCGEKKNELLRYFPLSPTSPSPAGIEVKDLPRKWKEKPSLDECQSFLYGWLAGYFAADGCVASGEYILSSAFLDNLTFARDVAVRLGMGTNPIRSALRKGFPDREPSLIYGLPIIGHTLREDFFLLKQHRERFLAKPSRAPHPWTVVSVSPTTRVEEVFCAVVPDGGAFTLEGNILTGNCLGCVKATSPTYWNHVRRVHPEVFADRAAQSREYGAKLVRAKGERIFLDELDPELQGRSMKTMKNECGIFCEEEDKQP